MDHHTTGVSDSEVLTLTTAGIDIGSATSQVVLATLTLEKYGVRYVVTDRKILRQSPVLLTPYRSATEIDERPLQLFVEAQFAAAGVPPDAIDAGVVVLTGTALSTTNATLTTALLGETSGKYVSIAAGDTLEGTLAAYGAGAVHASSADGCTYLNVDVGGGTCKVAVCEDGRVAVIALDVGSRLVVWDEAGRVTRLERTGQRLAELVGLEVRLGEVLNPADAAAMAAYAVSQILREISRTFATTATGDGPSPLLRPQGGSEARFDSEIAGVYFSGGVAEYIYGTVAPDDVRHFGDLGPLLADELRDAFSGFRIREVCNPIRATCLGLSQYSVQVSGDTVFLSEPVELPVCGLPVIKPKIDLSSPTVDPRAVARSIRESLSTCASIDGTGIAIVVPRLGEASRECMVGLSDGLIEGLDNFMSGPQAIILLCTGDVGQTVGRVLEERSTAYPDLRLISLDGVDAAAFDYVDVGRQVGLAGRAVTVVVKSLLFPPVIGQEADARETLLRAP
jgi:ethanolamine utilization protein EutA